MLVPVGDIRLFVEVTGLQWVADGDTMRRRPTVVLLHGGPGMDCASLKERFAFLPDVAQTVLYDHRGNGRSDDGDRQHWTLAQWGDDVRALCVALGIERPIVIGGSFGGMVAMSYATRHSEHPAALGLVATAAREPSADEVVEAFRRLGGDEVAELVRMDIEDSTPETSERFIREALPLMSRHPKAPERVRRETARTVRRQEVELHFTRGEMQTMDYRVALGSIRCPTLVISGELDPVCPPSCMNEIVEALPGDLAEAHLVAGAGHLVAMDAPEEFQRLVRQFVLRHAPG